MPYDDRCRSLALTRVLTPTETGPDAMVPTAIASFGDMTTVIITISVLSVLYCWLKEKRFKWGIMSSRDLEASETH